LIIDDEESIHQVLQPFLRELGYRAVSAFDGYEGLAVLEAHPSIEIVLTDVRIPGRDGLDVLREVKARNAHIRVIVMTAFSDKETAIQALRFGADDFLEKPFRLEELGRMIERHRDRDKMFAFARKWSKALAEAPLGVIRCDPHGRILEASPSALILLELSAAQGAGISLATVPGLEGLRVLFEALNAPQTAVEIKRNGRWLLVRAIDFAAPHDPDSRVLALSDISAQKILQRDINELTEAFEARVEERTASLSGELDFSQRLLDSVGVLVAYLDPEGRLARFNRFGEEITGLNRAAAEQLFAAIARDANAPLASVFDPASKQEVSGLVADLQAATGARILMSWTVRWLTGRAGSGGKLIVGVDITEQKHLENQLQNYNTLLQSLVESRSKELRLKDAQLIHTARLASLGEIAAGIAHEMKQPLNVISITADLIKLLHRNGTLNDDVLVSNLEKIRGTVDRMAATINHLRGFTRIDSANFRALKVTEIFDGALSIVGEQIRLDDIDVIQTIGDEVPRVTGELHQLEQVMVNLLQNARDAIEDRAREGAAAPGGPRLITLRARTSDDKSEVYLEIEDTGTGLTEEVRERLFEPFFTTKDSQRGTGLGLSISMNIVQSHGGVIEAESRPGAGSTFRIVLPAAGTESA
jgi:C4-dicarboxylate-specific signal transduction histidine kinase/ActR/RegA family two-component response regulator